MNPTVFPKDAPREWMADAACLGMDLAIFFPTAGHTGAAAKAVCATCAVRVECLAYADTTPSERYGVWGGTGARKRQAGRGAAGVRSGPPLVPCGNRSAYVRGCRCDLCREANTAWKRSWRARQREAS